MIHIDKSFKIHKILLLCYIISHMGRMYFDHTSKTPAGWHVPDAMLPHFNRQLGNHSSVFIEEGVIPKKAADEALLPVTSDSIKRLMEVLNKDREGDMEWQKNHIATK